MGSILHELYHGNYYPENQSYQPDSLYGKTFKKMVDLEEELHGRLSKEDAEKFSEYNTVSAEMTSIAGEISFREGFRLAVRLIVEGLGREEPAISG